MGTNIAIGNLVGKQKGNGGASNSYKLIAEYVFNKNNMDTDRNKVFNKLNSDQFIELYNFSWSLMSGYGGYNENYLTYSKAANVFVTDDHSITIMNSVPVNNWVVSKHGNSALKSTKIKVTGLTSDDQLEYGYSPSNEGARVMMPIPKDGIYDLPESIVNQSTFTIGFFIKSALTKNVIIEQVPAYPDCLVFDGVDDYTSIIPDFNKEQGTMIIQYTSMDGLKQILFQAMEERDVSIFSNCFLVKDESIQTRAENSVIKGLMNTPDENKITALCWDSDGMNLFNNGKYLPSDAINKHVKYRFAKDSNSNDYARFALKKILIFDKKLNEKQILEEYNKLLS